MVSYVVPVFDEEESLQKFYSELNIEAQKLGEDYEIIFVDDGSKDRSLSLLQDLQKKDTHVRLFAFRKNLGKAEALTLGFQKAQGRYIITLDADLQDKPSEATKLLKIAENTWDLVCGWREQRKDKKKMIAVSKLFNGLVNKFWGLKLHDYNCGLKVYSSDAAKSLHLYGGFHRFIPLLVHQQGFSVTEVPVQHSQRLYGKSKYGFSKIKDLPDMFTMLFLAKYSNRPMHFFGTVGGFLFIVGLLVILYLTILHFFGYSIARRPLLIFGMLLLLGGLQIFLTGFLADLILNSSRKEISYQPLKYASDTT